LKVYSNLNMNKKIAIVQSNYIPWKGYFDIINMVDEFIVYDDAQYTKRDWRNRNKIKTNHGLKWLTIPVKVKGRFSQSVNEVVILNKDWVSNHLKTIKHCYSKAKFFNEYYPFFENVYLNQAMNECYLSSINLLFIKFICKIFNINTKITLSSNYSLSKIGQTEKLIELCNYTNANSYLSGPNAKKYLDVNKFSDASIKLEWFNYDNYIRYNQLYPPFNHHVSIIDLILNEGNNSFEFLKSKRKL